MPPDYTGAWQLPDRELFVWRHRMLDVMAAVVKRGMALVCNPKDEAFMKDFLAWAMDPDQADAWAFPGTADLYTSTGVEEGKVYAWDPNRNRILTFSEMMNSRKGFGRWTGILLPGKGEITDPFKVYRDG